MARRARRVAVAAVVVVAAALLVAGMWPFDVGGLATDQGTARVRCGAALIEAWPERQSEQARLRYVPNSPEVFLPPAVRSRLCGAEARERLLLPLYGTVALLLLVLAALSCTRRRPQPQESSGDRL